MSRDGFITNEYDGQKLSGYDHTVSGANCFGSPSTP